MSYPPPPPGPSYGPPPGPPGPTPGGKPKLRGRVPLRLAAVFGVVGLVLVVVGIVVLVRSPLTKVDDFPRVALDGSPHTVTLDHGGDYVGYYEAPGLDTDKATPDGKLGIRDESGDDVAFRSYGRRRLTYDLDGHHGVAIITFHADTAGEYTFAGGGTGVPRTAQLAVGESIAHGVVVGVLLFLPGLLLVAAAVVLLVVGLVRRSRHKRELYSAYRTPWAGPPPPTW